MNCFCCMIDQRKPFSLISSREILTIANLLQLASRSWTCAEPEFRPCWMKSCTSDNLYTTAPNIFLTYIEFCRALNVIEYSWIMSSHYERKEFLNQTISSENTAKGNFDYIEKTNIALLLHLLKIKSIGM